MGKKKNPWRGLASYDDPINNSKDCYDFCGRDEEAIHLVKLIDNSLFVTLYGRTGVGKTSLLKAGVFPVLRMNNYIPLYIRLSHGQTNKSYAEIIIDEIERKDDVVVKRINNASLVNNDGDSAAFLWDYFCQTKFFNQEGQEIYPVVVLDQFEEILVNQEKAEKRRGEVLLKQIHALLSDDYVLLDRDSFSDETNYRFVASIREDNLYLLEDCIDEQSLVLLKENRYRLRPMNDKQARNAILIPGRRCIVEQDKEELASQIIDAAKDIDGTISSLMLSFICSQLYKKAAVVSADPQIDNKLFGEHQTESRRLLTEFYLQHTSKNQRKVIEEHYITEDGHRKPSKESIPHSRDLVEKYNIMQDAKTENGDGLEIVHDRLAEVIYMHRRQRESKMFRNVLVCTVAAILLALLGLAVSLSWSSSVRTGGYFTIYNEPKNFPPTDTILNDTIINVASVNPRIKNVIIGENVDSISSLSIAAYGQKIIVSPQNKRIKSDYIYYFSNTSSDSVQYLYYTDDPTTAIFLQRKLQNKDYHYRLPKGLVGLRINNESIIRQDRDAPCYGEETIEIKTEKELAFTRGDKRVKNLVIRDLLKIPSWNYQDCTSLEKVDLGVEEMSLGDVCFDRCVNLQEVILPKKLLFGDSERQFARCYNLKKITLPDMVDRPERLAEMFDDCPNISEVNYSEKSHFHEAEDGIIYYDSIPVIFNKCKTKDWVDRDSVFHIIDAVVVNVTEDGGNIYNILPAHWKVDHSFRTEKGMSPYIIYNKDLCKVMDLPLESVLYFNYNPNLKEIHTPISDPNKFRFECPFMNLRDVTLYVPYGCRTSYYESGKFGFFKEIKEDSLTKRILQTFLYWWRGVKYTFGAHSWLLYPIVLFVLALLAFVFYKLKMYQMSKRGIVSTKKAVLYAVLADFAAVIGFVPVYYTFYCLASNHYWFDYMQICIIMSIVLLLFAYFVIRLIIETRKRFLWPWLLFVVVLLGVVCIIIVMNWGDKYYDYQCIFFSSFLGGLSGYICAYLTTFAGDGKILNKVKRWKLSE